MRKRRSARIRKTRKRTRMKKRSIRLSRSVRARRVKGKRRKSVRRRARNRAGRRSGKLKRRMAGRRRKGLRARKKRRAARTAALPAAAPPEPHAQPEAPSEPPPEPAAESEPSGTHPLAHTKTIGWLHEMAASGHGIPYYAEFFGDQPYRFADSRTLEGQSGFGGHDFLPAPGYVAVLPNGRLWGVNGSVITQGRALLADVSFEFESWFPERHPVFHHWQEYPVVRLPGTTAALTFCESANYFHWMYDVLARLQLLRLSGVPIDRYVINRRSILHWGVGSSPKKSFHAQTLELLGIPQSMVVDTHEHFHIEAERLAVASIPHELGYPKWTCDFLRSEFSSKLGLQPNPHRTAKIYISRGDAVRRRIVNEPDVIALLSQHGFQPYVLETMSLVDQIRLFHSAAAIVAPHGAGLTNLTFSQPGTKVVEMFANDWRPPCYWMISSYVGLEHYSLFGTPVPIPNMRWPGEADILINTDELRKLLHQAGLSG